MSQRIHTRLMFVGTGWSVLGMLALALPGHASRAVSFVDEFRITERPCAADNPRLLTPSFQTATNPNPTLREQVQTASGDMTDDVLLSLKGKYANKRPLKVHSTLVLALDTGHRRRIVVRPIRPYVSDEEFDLACLWLDRESRRFDDLLDRRIAIMQNEKRAAIPQLLEYNDIAAQLLSRKVNREIIARLHQRRREIRIVERQKERRRGY